MKEKRKEIVFNGRRYGKSLAFEEAWKKLRPIDREHGAKVFVVKSLAVKNR